jgi:5-methylcytosine-specific restriction endonuclease McrA
MHHFTPRSQGGRNSPYNLVALCRQCHVLAHEGSREERDKIEYRVAEYLGDFYAEDDDFYASL